MSKKLPSLLSCLLLIPAVANALGLGPIKLHSALNQPLDASIQLLSVKDINSDDIKVKLASDKDFERVGVDKTFVLTMLNFKVVGDGDNRKIQITSTGRISDTYLRFLLDVSTPDGQFFRVYTVLLDPVNYTPSSVASPAQSLPGQSYRRTTTVQITSRPAATITNSYTTDHVTHAVSATYPVTSQQQSIPASVVPPAAKPVLSIQTHYGPIKANDTLYEIAARYKTNNSMTVNQIMLAIVGANPEAFTNNNINLLKTGHMLSIPSADVIKSIPADLARQEVAQQDRAWHNHSQIKHLLAPPFYQLQADQNSNVPSLVPAGANNSLDQTTPPPANQDADQPPAESSIKPIYSDIEAAKNPQTPSSNVPLPAELQMRAPDANTIESSPLLQSSPQPTSSNEKNLQAELAVSAGAVTAVQQSNLVLQQQIKALEEQNQQLQASMNNKDAQLKNLQDHLIQSQPQINQPIVAQASKSPATTTLNSNTAYINASATTTVPTVITPAVAGQAVAEKNHQPRGWFSTFFLSFVILVGAVVAGVTWLFNRQQRVGVKAANMYDYDEHTSRQSGDEQNGLKQPFVATEVKPKKNSSSPEIVKPTVKTEAVQNNGQSSQRQAPVKVNDTLDEDKNSIEYIPETIKTDNSLQKSKPASDTYDEFAGKGEDVVATKLNLSVAYFNMEDYAAAKKLLQEVIQDGDEQQQKEAQELLNRIVE